eukprot:1892486-Rhodomonas_salina.1
MSGIPPATHLVPDPFGVGQMGPGIALPQVPAAANTGRGAPPAAGRGRAQQQGGRGRAAMQHPAAVQYHQQRASPQQQPNFAQQLPVGFGRASGNWGPS